METTLLRTFLTFLAVLTSSTSKKSPHNSFLWRINSEPASYFFGTIHVPYTRVWNSIAQNTKEAFQQADAVVFELDLTNPDTLSALSACQLLPKDLRLSQVLPTELYLRLQFHLEYVRQEMPSWITQDQIERGIYAEDLYAAITSNWERKQPIWVTLMVNSLTKSDVASRGFPVLDLYLRKLASKQKKSIGAIEKVEEQCEPLNRLNSSQVVFALNQTLKRQEELRLAGSSRSFSRHHTTDDLIDSYRSGNLDKVIFSRDSILLPSLTPEDNSMMDLNPSERRMARSIDNFFRQFMINKRNRQMASRVINLLVNQPGKSYFFAFGAGHFVGNGSVLDYVQSAGYRIEHIHPGEKLNHFQGSYGSSSKTTVQGTFDDLSENEKTRALLQFLQYHQQQEQKEETLRFQKLLNERRSSRPFLEDEKTLKNSLRLWYGLDNSTTSYSSSSVISTRINSGGIRHVSLLFLIPLLTNTLYIFNH